VLREIDRSFRNSPERMDRAGCNIENSAASVRQHASDKFGNIVDQHVVAALFAISK
jgi:hypothetical protein